MTETTAPTVEITRTSTAARIGWAILILATLYVCYFSHLGAIGFVGPDEPRYAWIARDMVESGDWVTPRLYGKPWFEKPPLFYWGAALCFKLIGVSEAAARLPSAISALLATLALAWLALRLYGAETARWLLLLLPTTVGMIGFSHAAATDMPFSGTLTIAMACAAVVLGLTRNENTPILPRTPWLALILFGFFLGLAVLAKGPAAIILSGGGIFFWALFTKRWRDAFRLLHPAAIASFCLTALPWYIVCARRNPDFFRIFIIEHNFKRYLTPEFQHLQPFWYYLPIVLIALFPWTIFVFPLASDALRWSKTRRQPNVSTIFFIALAIFPVLFFTISRSKLPGYILPAVPPLLFLLTRSFVSRAGSDATLSRVFIVNGFVFVGISLWLSHKMSLQPLFSLFTEKWAYVGTVSILCSGALIAILALFRNKWIALFAVLLLALTVIEIANRQLLPRLDRIYSLRFARGALLYWRENNSVIVRSFKLQRSWLYQLNYYGHSEVQEWNPEKPVGALVVTSPAGLQELSRLRDADPPRLRYKGFDILGAGTSLEAYTVGVRPLFLSDRPSNSGQPH